MQRTPSRLLAAALVAVFALVAAIGPGQTQESAEPAFSLSSAEVKTPLSGPTNQ